MSVGDRNRQSFPANSGRRESVAKSTPKRSLSSAIATYDRIGIGKQVWRRTFPGRGITPGHYGIGKSRLVFRGQVNTISSPLHNATVSQE